MIKRILGFRGHDWKHLGSLFMNMIIQLLKGELTEAVDAWYWICIHLSYNSRRKR